MAAELGQQVAVTVFIRWSYWAASMSAAGLTETAVMGYWKDNKFCPWWLRSHFLV